MIKLLQVSLKAKKERELALESTKEKEHADWQENNNSICVKQILFDLKDSFYLGILPGKHDCLQFREE